MVNEQLTKYIETVQEQGFSETMIREVLEKNGWGNTDINDAFTYLRMQKASLIAQAPISPTMTKPNIVLPGEETTSKNDQASSEQTIYPKSIEYNSPFSAGLAVVLFVAIMILLNKVIDDSAFYTNTVNAQLIFDVLIVIPFILIAFILRESFPNTGKRYLLVSQPYFVVSALLLVRLLWDTSKYILNTNATYGVYVVLVLIIIVLTGAILFVQKYIKA